MSLTDVIIALLALEAASIILLLGAQVIIEYGRLLPKFGAIADSKEPTKRMKPTDG